MPSQFARSTFAQRRIERIIGRVFSLATVATSLETLLNASSESKLISPVYLYGSMSLILVAQLVAVYNFWFGPANKYVYLLHGFAYVVAYFAYPFSVISSSGLPVGFRPWLWWATGTAAMAMGMYLPKWWSFVYLTFMPVSWFVLRVQPIGGSGDVGTALLDSVYIVLYAAAIMTLVGMLRLAALRVDQKNDEAAEAATKRATSDAAELERQNLDDLVHDQVLTTLLLAAKAEDDEARLKASESAGAAITRLQATASDELGETQEISVRSYLDSLAESLRRGYPEFEVNLTNQADFALPISVGIAFSDATIQALTNSMQHAGRNVKREVRLKADHHGLKIVVIDNGKGFRVSAIPKNRFGVRNSIRRRVISVGGDVNIKTAPRQGATIVLTWGDDA